MQDQETVILQGHIIDSLILAKVLDRILMLGGTFDLQDVQIGKTREEPSRARIIVRASTATLLSEILHAIQPHGASVENERDCRLAAAPADGIFPDEFYATTHLSTQVRMREQWVEVEGIEMDMGIRVDRAGLTARTLPMGEVRQGDLIVTGREGVRVIP
ncbi:MAG: TIGR00300 family protein, partial [Nitrospirota bacterium]|nr:TIGR00300 family protein [Nitrospirota bacterium]